MIFLAGCSSPGSRPNTDGVQYYQQGQAQAAMLQFEQALVENPNNPDAYYNPAACYQATGKKNSDAAMGSSAGNPVRRDQGYRVAWILILSGYRPRGICSRTIVQ